MSKNTNRDLLIKNAARDVLALSRSILMVRLRFMDIALNRLDPVPTDGVTLATDGARLMYGPEYVLRLYKNEQERPVRDYLHVILHCIYSHMFVGNLAEPELWDLACDIAVESTINDLGIDVTASCRKAAQSAETATCRCCLPAAVSPD